MLGFDRINNKNHSEKMTNIEEINIENNQPSRAQAEQAVRTLLSYIGEDPNRPGLVETPARYVRAFDEFFSGYNQDPAKELSKTFDDIDNYHDIVLVKDIDFVSHCEHHIVPIKGRAHVAYIPDKKVVGISKLARIVDIYAKRLTSQENMTSDIAHVLINAIQAKGAAVFVNANHQCMSTRGVNKPGSSTTTCCFLGDFKTDAELRTRFMDMIR